jgi:hypothetical protein
MQLQTVLCCTYNMIFITQFLKQTQITHSLRVTTPPPQKEEFGASHLVQFLAVAGIVPCITYPCQSYSPHNTHLKYTGNSTISGHSMKLRSLSPLSNVKVQNVWSYLHIPCITACCLNTKTTPCFILKTVGFIIVTVM